MITDFAALPLGLPVILIFLIALVLLIFEVYMFVHVIRNKYITPNVRTIWIIGMLIIHPFVAIAYALTDFKKTN
jgi:heme/copper-type cytochrome/quinol oxidase subunit 4